MICRHGMLIEEKSLRGSKGLNCLSGVTKIYKLIYEAKKIEHALFNPHGAKNRWRIGANVLRSFIEYFGANTEHLDFYAEGGRATFTSYTEKVANGKEILKYPLETSIALDTLDFEDFAVEEKVHVAISVKDFKAIVAHADSLKTSVQANYSFPSRPLQLAYNEQGMQCEFTLATIGDYRGSSVTPALISDRSSSALPGGSQSSRQVSAQPTQSNNDPASDSNVAMPPPSQPASRSFQHHVHPAELMLDAPQQPSTSQRPSRPSPPPPKASLDPESLFIPGGSDDAVWDEPNDEEEEILGWDTNARNVNQTLENLLVKKIAYTLKEGSRSRGPHEYSTSSSHYRSLPAWSEDTNQRVPPTQRLADVLVCPDP
ncbi:MAG: hypothetical protein Q9219_005209 [cf. Caloplaca sp. 3 TL-2023]